MPRFEIGAVTLPLVKMLTHYYQFPTPIKKTLRSLNLVQELVYYLKKFYLGIEVKRFKPNKVLKILPKRLLTNFIDLSRSDDNFEKIFKTMFTVPINLDYDGWGVPEPLLLDYIGKKVRRDNGEYGIVLADGKVWDLDLQTGDMIEVELIHEGDAGKSMMKYYTDFINSFDFERYYGAIENALNQKINGEILKDQIVPILFIRGLMSSWLYAFPLRKMNLLFKYVFKEYRKKDGPGIYGQYLRERTNYIKKHIDHIAKLGLPAILLGDDQAEVKGPYFKPKIYKKVFKPLYKDIADHAHSKGVKVILHSDGRFRMGNPDAPDHEGWEFMDDCVIDQGMDAWHSVEMEANNVYKVKKHVKGKLTLFGSIDTEWLQYYGPEKIRYEVFKHLKGFLEPDGGGLDGFIPGSDNSIISSTRIESWLSMIRTIDDFSDQYIKNNK
ncbi:MAG: hypothetical protein GF329_19130 [Candidatus Lokiarchaeota archaeon]|nr:hypothetical protein [Candidatus Lokiarchaeota archaeon]